MGKVIVHYSTGLGSTESARRAIDKYGVGQVILLTTDTMIEDEDNWRFAKEAHEFLGSPEWVILRVGMTPMEVGRAHKAIPNNRMAICSRLLKRAPAREWIDEHCEPGDIQVLGFDWTEEHRYESAKPHWEPYQLWCPLLEPPYKEKGALIEEWRNLGVNPPRLYDMGFAHANCGGGCVRSGQAQWARLLQKMPERYAEWEAEEEKSRAELGKDVSILKAKGRPLTLRTLRRRIESQQTFDDDEWGACSCYED